MEEATCRRIIDSAAGVVRRFGRIDRVDRSTLGLFTNGRNRGREGSVAA